MKSVITSDSLMARRPAGTPEQYYSWSAQQFLDEPFFRSAIYLASPVYYRLLQKKNFKLVDLFPKEVHTLQKYINRYCFRPVPFGLFAGYNFLTWPDLVESTEASGVSSHLHLNAERAVVIRIGEEIIGKAPGVIFTFRVNPTVYAIGDTYRYIIHQVDEESGRREYLLQEIRATEPLKCLHQISGEEISESFCTDLIIRVAGCSRREAQSYFRFLVNVQYLYDGRIPALTGGDIFHQLTQAGALKLEQVEKLLKWKEKSIITKVEDPDSIRQLDMELAELTGYPPDKTCLFGTLRVDGPTPSLPHGSRALVEKALSILTILIPPVRPSGLEIWKKEFVRRFDQRSIPLLLALDPERGISYDTLPASTAEATLLETVSFLSEPAVPNLNWTSVHICLLSAWLSNGKEQDKINLTEEMLETLGWQEKSELHTDGQSCLFRFWGDELFIEMAGGVNPVALLGRFTVNDGEAAAIAKKIAEETERRNPGVIFAEILHQGDPHVDNINMRSPLYTYDLPLTDRSVLPSSQQINLKDLYVSVENNKIKLRLKMNGTEVRPRLSSAYNHSRNDLPLFRFLVDHGHQDTKSNLSLDLAQFFPGQSFYPRVQFQDIILSPATWSWNKDELQPLREGSGIDQTAEFYKLAEISGLPFRFCIAEHDQQLVIDRRLLTDVQFFCSYIRHQEKVLIKEYGDQDLKIDHAPAQYIAFTLPTQADRVMAQPVMSRDMGVIRSFLPGSEWSYFKIYCHPASVGALLTGKLLPFLNGGRRSGIKKWYFVRYQDPDHHVRLKLNVMPERIGEVLAALRGLLEKELDHLLIREVRIDTYERELERYGPHRIRLAEQYFWKSSELTGKIIARKVDDVVQWQLQHALFATIGLIRLLYKEPVDAQNFAEQMYHLFSKEAGNKHERYELDQRFRVLRSEIAKMLSARDFATVSRMSIPYRRFFQAADKVLSYSDETLETERQKLLADMVHMHLNRIFDTQQRRQEMVVYFLLEKFIRSQLARQK